MNATLLTTGKPIRIEEIESLEHNLGEATPAYGTCGGFFLCKDCIEKGKEYGCGKRFTVRKVLAPETYTVNLLDGKSIPICLPDYTVLKRLLFLLPFQVQRQRAKGWRMPENTVFVGRPTKWGNPYRLGQSANGWFVYGEDGERIGDFQKDKVYAASIAVQLYREMIERILASDPHALDELANKKIACWCPIGQPCHRDVLIELSNQPKETRGKDCGYEF